MAFPAVNCYALISGYVGYREEKYYPNFKNIIVLFFEVLFYSVFITLIFKIIYPSEIGLAETVKAFFPVTTKKYWFFSAYFGTVLISPALNCFVHKSDNKMALFSVTTGGVLFSLLPTFLKSDIFNFNGGYSFVWLTFLYVIGAIIKKYAICKRLKKKTLFIIMISMFLFTWGLKVFFSCIDISILGISLSRIGNVLISYVSPTILGVALCMLMLFSKFEINVKLFKAINFFASSSFAVYLIHNHSLFSKYVMRNLRDTSINLTSFYVLAYTLFFTVAIYVFCCLVDKLRMLLFKIFCINKLADKVYILFNSVIQKFLDKIKYD